MPYPLRSLGRRIFGRSVRAIVRDAGRPVAQVAEPQVGGIRRQLHLVFGAPGPSKYLAPDEDTLRGYLRDLATKPGHTLSTSMREATNIQKGMMAGSVGMELPGVMSGTREERAGAAGSALGSGIGALAFRKAPLLPDLVGNLALSSLGGALGKSLAGVGG